MIKTVIKLVSLIGILMILVGCASTPTNPEDPYESYNRKMFAFNEFADKYAILPVARGYDYITPEVVQEGIGNVFGNLNELPVISNDLLQGQFSWAMADFWRLLINSTAGVGGIFDVAAHAGLNKRSQDLGMTLAKWGADDSPYLVLPFLGPMTVRDMAGEFTDYGVITVYPYIHPFYVRWGILTFYYFHLRAQLLPTQDLIEESLDPYVFVRDAYLQRRNFLIDKNQGKATASETQTDEDNDFYIEDEDADTKDTSKQLTGEKTTQKQSDAKPKSSKADAADPYVE